MVGRGLKQSPVRGFAPPPLCVGNAAITLTIPAGCCESAACAARLGLYAVHRAEGCTGASGHGHACTQSARAIYIDIGGNRRYGNFTYTHKEVTSGEQSQRRPLRGLRPEGRSESFGHALGYIGMLNMTQSTQRRRHHRRHSCIMSTFK
jgi:hypothetical protein